MQPGTCTHARVSFLLCKMVIAREKSISSDVSNIEWLCEQIDLEATIVRPFVPRAKRGCARSPRATTFGSPCIHARTCYNQHYTPSMYPFQQPSPVSNPYCLFPINRYSFFLFRHRREAAQPFAKYNVAFTNDNAKLIYTFPFSGTTTGWSWTHSCKTK